jgi:GH24 family phage-related lysozyme (muramidase)
MYLDIMGLVTIGIGNLIDPVSEAKRLPFRFKANNRLKKPAAQVATAAEIEAEWNHIKNHPLRVSFMQRGHRLCEPETNLEINATDLITIFNAKTASNEKYLRRVFTAYDQWPADAQLPLMSMAWNLGPAFHKTWPKFTKACLATDFDAAALQCLIPGSERNTPHQALFRNAATVLANPTSYHANHLYYPTVLLDEVNVVV